MNKAPNINLTVPQLRALIISRGINIGNARTKKELQNLLTPPDIPNHIHINQPIRVLPEKVTTDIRNFNGIVSPPYTAQIVPNVIPKKRKPKENNKLPQKYDPKYPLDIMKMVLTARISKWQYPIYTQRSFYGNDVLYSIPSYETIASLIYMNSVNIVIVTGTYLTIHSSYNLMEYLMTQVTPKFIAQVVSFLGFKNLSASIDTYYNLLWYLSTSNIQHIIIEDEKIYISGLSVNEIIKLLGPNYKGPRDHASLLFAAVSGTSTSRPDIENIEKYKLVRTYSPENVWLLADKFYNFVDRETQIVSMYPPYIYVSLQDNSAIERLFVSVDDNNVDKFLLDYQMPLPPFSIYTLERKVKYFKKQIQRYDAIFTRNPNMLPLQIIHRENITIQEIIKMLSPYTLKEILETYEPVNIWKSWEELLDLLREFSGNLTVTPQWSWRHNFCANDDTFNVLDMDLHKDMDKNNLEDPTISYGIPGNYRCYQILELIAAWNEDEEGIFRFTVPDWTNKTKDNITNKMLDKEFPIESIKQLKQLVLSMPKKWIKEQPKNYMLTTLSEKVVKGLLSLKILSTIMNKLQKEYNNFDENRKYLVKLYLCWLFIFGMWLRFWKGQGNPWPDTWVENGGGDRCTLAERIIHIEIQGYVRNVILEGLDADQELKEWVKELPLVDYDLITLDAKMVINGEGPIKNINNLIEQIIGGNFCMAHGSDFTIRSSYYLIINILGINTEENINNYINEMLPKLLEIEKKIVSCNLQEMLQNTRTDDGHITVAIFNNSKDILESRLKQLDKPYIQQDTLKINNFRKSGHLERAGRFNIIFDD